MTKAIWSHCQKKKKKTKTKTKTKSMKHNCKVAQILYGFIYTNIAEQFKIYVDSLLLDQIDEIENDWLIETD